MGKEKPASSSCFSSAATAFFSGASAFFSGSGGGGFRLSSSARSFAASAWSTSTSARSFAAWSRRVSTSSSAKTTTRDRDRDAQRTGSDRCGASAVVAAARSSSAREARPSDALIWQEAMLPISS